MTGPLIPGEDVALFIDWENFKISLATGQRTPNVSALKEEVSNLGRVVVAKAYADWVARTPELRGASQFTNDPPALYAAGIEPVYVPTRLSYGDSQSNRQRTTWVKNSVDVKMTADCIECAHSYPNIGTYVLVSGDSDFIHVVHTLRTMGKRVVIIGVSWATSRRLADSVDGLILYDVDVDPLIVPEPIPAGNGRSPSRSDSATRPDLAEIIREIEEIVRSERHAGGTPLLTSIKQRVMRRYPGFDEKQLGYSGFKKLMARVAQEGNIKLTTVGLVDWATMADEPAPSVTDIQALEPKKSRTGWLRGRRSKAAPAEPESEVPAPNGDEVLESAEFEASQEFDPQPVTEGFPDSIPAESPAAQPAAAMSPTLENLITETTTGLELPEAQGDGLDPQRIADLIVMADTLEHREGISHVAFNFLLAEVCQALEQGLVADHPEITQRWSQVYSRSYVGKMLRGLSNGNLFQRGWHSWREEASGQQRRRRTFNLDRNHPVIEQVLKDRWETGSATESDNVPIQQSEPAQIWGTEFSDDSLQESEETGQDNSMAPAIPEDESSGFLSRLFRPRS